MITQVSKQRDCVICKSKFAAHSLHDKLCPSCYREVFEGETAQKIALELKMEEAEFYGNNETWPEFD